MPYTVLVASLLCLALPAAAYAAFGGQPPLGPKDNLRRLLQPYDLVKLNYLGMNYCENLLDMRVNLTSYTHLNFASNSGDAWHLQFADDTARLIECIAWEEQFSPVVRLELARRLTKGLIAAHIPGTGAYHSFRHRSGGKTFLILGDSASPDSGRLLLSEWGDSLTGSLKVGFRVQKDGRWHQIDGFSYSEEPEGAGSPGTARSRRYWNQSPFVFKRHYAREGVSVDFTGRYWLSDDDKPLEYGFSCPNSDRLQIVVGEPEKAMPMMGDAAAPGIIHLPDRLTLTSDADGDQVVHSPSFNYLILRKKTAWACPGYSRALLVMWDGRPESIEAMAENGYGQIRVTYSQREGSSAGRVWLFPVYWLNENDMHYLYRNAESFLRQGTLIHNGLPSQQLVNAIPAGIAAGAFVLTRYNDPFAETARINAANAVDAIFEGERDGKKLVRVFFPVKAAAWMVKTGRELGDGAMVAKYTSFLDQVMRRMLSSESGYDGNGWPGGWDHFNAAKAVWLAYDATGNEDYVRAWERAAEVYTIDEKGIYRYGQPMQAPGGFETYFGSLPLGVWGLAGKLDWIDLLINLDVPASASKPEPRVKDLWNDAGAGPWAQDDANPEYLGISLKAAAIPVKTRHIIPVGAFPIYHANGSVKLTRQPIVENPFFPAGHGPVETLPGGRSRAGQPITSLALTPGSAPEKEHLASPAGRIEGGRRVCSGRDNPLVYRFSTAGSAGAAIDFDIYGDSFQVELSPDGRRWYTRLDTWSEKPGKQSVDASFLTGSRDELPRLFLIRPEQDAAHLADISRAPLDGESCRRIEEGGSFTYKLDLPEVVECRLEVLASGNCRIECSNDGQTWREERGAGHIDSAGPDNGGWLRMVDVTRYASKSGVLYLRFSNREDSAGAFVSRVAVLGAIKSDALFVRLSNTSRSSRHSFTLSRLTLRTWGPQSPGTLKR